MAIQLLRSSAVVLVLAASAQIASAQTGYNANPTFYSPYSRPALSPYLNLLRGGDPAANYYMGVLREIDIRNQVLRPIILAPDLFSPYDPTRSGGTQYFPSTAPQNVEDWINQRVKETQLSPTGHPVGFLVTNPYFNQPNLHSFIPYNPNPRGGAGQGAPATPSFGGRPR